MPIQNYSNIIPTSVIITKYSLENIQTLKF